MTKRDGIVDDFQLLHHALGNLHTILMGLEGEHAGEIFHLGFGKSVLRMRSKAGIEHPLDCRMAFEICRHFHGCFLMRSHAKRKCCSTAHDQPRIEGRQDATEMHRRFQVEGVEIGLAANDRAAHGITMTSDIFGERMNNKIRTQA